MGYNIDDKTRRIIGHFMGVQAGTKMTVQLCGCQMQKGLDCGPQVLAMALAFFMGQDPSTAKLSHPLLRETLEIIFENQIVQIFPTPQAGEEIAMVKERPAVTFDVPKLWHNRVEAGKAPAA